MYLVSLPACLATRSLQVTNQFLSVTSEIIDPPSQDCFRRHQKLKKPTLLAALFIYIHLPLKFTIYRSKRPLKLHSSATSRLRMRRRVFVAESALRNKSFIDGLCSLEGEAGADLAVGCTLKSVPWFTGKSRDTVRFGGLIENLGIGKELGGGEFEYAGPAQRSEKGKFSFPKPMSS
jgi:hypothetical protein